MIIHHVKFESYLNCMNLDNHNPDSHKFTVIFSKEFIMALFQSSFKIT